MADWFLYIIETDGQRLYTGITTDVSRRFEEHKTGKGARFMRGRKTFTLRHQQKVGNRSLASKAEYAFKQLKRSEKLYWISHGSIPFHPETGKLMSELEISGVNMSDTEQQTKDPRPYGTEDASFQAAGGEAGIKKLVDAFYQAMDTLPEAKRIRDMHDEDLTVSADKLYRFLCGWLGGPKLFREKYGPIAIPRAHGHLDIGFEDRDAWMRCMEEALKTQDYAEDFNAYLMTQLMVPAERCRTRD